MASSLRSTLKSLTALTLATSTLVYANFIQETPSQKVKLPERTDSLQMIELGRLLFHDTSLSEPQGMACVTCHDPSTGYSYPNSFVNGVFGTVPGVIKNRFGSRRPPSIAYAPYLAKGIPHYDSVAIAWVGGLFWDGRARTAEDQVIGPLTNPNEMNNTKDGVPSPEMVVQKLKKSSTAEYFKATYGKNVFSKPTADIIKLLSRAIVAYEASPHVSSFTSKYDAYLDGKATLTPQELLGMRIATGTLNGRPDGFPFRKNAHCMDCHALSDDLANGPDIMTNSCYANLGIPKNDNNLFFLATDKKSNPTGYNPDGKDYVDMGLAGFIYPYYGWTPRKPHGSDPLRLIGTFKAPTLRNVDKRPYPGFIKAYMHNGAFKSLKEVVHFYNTRNLTSEPGELINYTLPDPYANLKGKPLWAKPEYMNPDSLINPTGLSSGAKGASTAANPLDPDAMQIGNLLLTESQEEAIVAFLKTLTDGYYKR